MALFVSVMWMVYFVYLQFTLMLTDRIVALRDTEDKQRSNRLTSTGFAASNFWLQSQTSRITSSVSHPDRSYQSLSVRVTKQRHFEGVFWIDLSVEPYPVSLYPTVKLWRPGKHDCWFRTTACVCLQAFTSHARAQEEKEHLFFEE